MPSFVTTPTPTVSVTILRIVAVAAGAAAGETASGSGAPPDIVVVGALAIVHEDLVGLRDLLESKGGAVPDGLG